MRVLVACEFSGIVRDAFRAKGHDAWSMDLLPTESDPSYHIQGDISGIIEGWSRTWGTLPDSWNFDLMIAHPPCTYLCNSGVRWLHSNPERWDSLVDGADLFEGLLNIAKIPRVCIENPIPHKYAVKLIGRKYDQIIQPWQYGHGETKATCLWLKNLPKLVPTDIVDGREARIHLMSPGPNRGKERSRFLTGFANAMAEQWGDLSCQKMIMTVKNVEIQNT